MHTLGIFIDFSNSLGAQIELCAFRCALSFTTAFGQFGGAEFKKVGYIICIRGNCTARTVKSCTWSRKIISDHEGRRPLNIGCKMIAIAKLVGTERNNYAPKPLLFKLLSKN